MNYRLLAAAAIAATAILAPTAGADPTQHFDTSFAITCGGHTLVIVAKPGSSQVISFDGQPTNSVSILFGYHVTDPTGAVIVDFHKPITEHQQLSVCIDTSWPPGYTATAETLITPR